LCGEVVVPFVGDMMQMTEDEPEHFEEVVGSSVPCKHTHVPLWPPSSSSSAAAANQDDDDDDAAILGFQ
jgi:hypothetical protein